MGTDFRFEFTDEIIGNTLGDGFVDCKYLRWLGRHFLTRDSDAQKGMSARKTYSYRCSEPELREW